MHKNAWLDTLPEPLSRQIKTAYVPAHVKRLFSYLPQPVTLTASLCEPLPRGAAQLCKLALGSTRLTINTVQTSSSTQLTLTLAERSVHLSDELNNDLTSLTKKALQELFSPGDLFAALEDFSFQSSTLETFQQITHQMISAQDIDRLSYLLLLGVTSGESLGFHRAVFFSFDEATGQLIGAKALGPSTLEEAHRIWEELEFQDATFEWLTSESSQQSIDVRLQQKISNIKVSAKQLAEVLSSPGPMIFSSREEWLSSIEPSASYVLAPLRARQRLLGLIFADHIVTGEPASPQQLLLLRLFLEQTALLWESFLLLKRLENLASYDGLTGVLTRREFDARFAAEILYAGENQTPCALLILDLDSFKQINDTKGHAAGDEILRRVGAILRRELRRNDLVGRFGGDEFVIFLPHAKHAELSLVASRLLQTMSTEEIFTSIGGACFPDGCESPTQLFVTADQNLYRAKQAGRNQMSLRSVIPEPL